MLIIYYIYITIIRCYLLTCSKCSCHSPLEVEDFGYPLILYKVFRTPNFCFLSGVHRARVRDLPRRDGDEGIVRDFQELAVGKKAVPRTGRL